jgi:hypothetical protein
MRDDGTNSFVCRDKPRPMALSPLECGTGGGRGYPGPPVLGRCATFASLVDADLGLRTAPHATKTFGVSRSEPRFTRPMSS